MRFQILFLGAILGLAAMAQGQTGKQEPKTTQSADRMKQFATAGEQSVTGCVDEQNGHYVLHDVQTSQLVTLKSTGTDDDSQFAKFLGHQTQASGNLSSGTMKVARIAQVADMCGSGQ